MIVKIHCSYLISKDEREVGDDRKDELTNGNLASKS